MPPALTRRAALAGSLAWAGTAWSAIARGDGAARLGVTDGVGRPALQPYPGHVNRPAELPPWTGLPSTTSSRGNMLMFRGNPAHAYYGSGPLPAAPKVAWRFRMSDLKTSAHGDEKVWRGMGWTGQSLKWGAFVFAASTGGHMHCFEAETGALRWVTAAHGPFKGSPCFFENRIYAPNVDNQLRCLDASTGQKLWAWSSGGDIDSSPCVVDGVLYIGGEDGWLKSLDPRTGRLLWYEDFGVGVGEAPGSGGIESSVAVVGGRAYFGHLDGSVRAYDLAARRVVWKTPIGQDVDASPLVVGDRIFIGSEAGAQTFLALAADDGRVLWAHKLRGGVWSSAAWDAGRVFVGCNRGYVTCFDAANGAVVWQQPLGAAVWSSPAVVDGVCIVGAFDGVLRGLDAATGRVLWSVELGGRVHAAPCIEDGKIWVGTTAGSYVCLS